LQSAVDFEPRTVLVPALRRLPYWVCGAMPVSMTYAVTPAPVDP
jgi:hypothetical protein